LQQPQNCSADYFGAGNEAFLVLSMLHAPGQRVLTEYLPQLGTRDPTLSSTLHSMDCFSVSRLSSSVAENKLKTYNSELFCNLSF
jgi:hypothetical protein